jgi:hypothetical protein
MTSERSDPMAAGRRWKQKHRLTHPVWVDEDDSAGDAFGVRAFPTNVIIDRKGVVRYVDSGFDSKTVDRWIRGLIAR